MPTLKEKWGNEPKIWNANILADFARIIAKKHHNLKNGTSVQWTETKDPVAGASLGTVDPVIESVGNNKYAWYIFDWRQYNKSYGGLLEYKSDNLINYFKDYVWKSIDIAIRSFGKKPPDNMTTFIFENVEFGDYDVQVFTPGEDPINPGLKFLIGIKREGGLDDLPNDSSAISKDPLNLELSILVKRDSFEQDFDKIADTIEFYDSLREGYEGSFKINTISGANDIDLKKEAEYVRDFTKDLKQLLDDARSKDIAAGKHNARNWNAGGNMIEILFSGAKNNLKIAMVNEYIPEGAFVKGIHCPAGPTSIGRLSTVRTKSGSVRDQNGIKGPAGIKDARSIFNAEPYNDAWKYFSWEGWNSSHGPSPKAAGRPRTLGFISQLHGKNSSNKGLSQPQLELRPPTIDIITFIKKYTIDLKDIEYEVEGPDAYRKATKKANASPIAGPDQRRNAVERSNNKSWGQEYIEWRDDVYEDVKDKFWDNVPEKRDRLSTIDDVYAEVLNDADVQILTKELLRCLNPQDWIEIACRKVVDELGIDTLIENMQKDGTLDMLLERAEGAKDVFGKIESEKRLSADDFDELNNEIQKYDEELKVLNKKKQDATTDAERAEIGKEIEDVRSRRRMAEVDAWFTKANQSAGAWVPISQDDAEKGKQFAHEMSELIMMLKDPNFKEQICKNLIGYLAAILQFLSMVFSGEIFNKLPAVRLEPPIFPKLQTDDIGKYFADLLKQIGAQILATLLLFTVKALLTELLEACQKIKADLWDEIDPDDPKKNFKIPGKAKFKDLLAQSPNKAALKLAKGLAKKGIPIEENVIISLLGLMEDLEALLSQLELCSLVKGTATMKVMTIVRNLLEVRYSNLYTSLQGTASALSNEKIKDFFMTFQPLVEGGYCEEIMKPVEFNKQLYQECIPMPYSIPVRESLLAGHATNEQIDNIIRRAKLDRLDRIKELIDLATGENPLNYEPPDCTNSSMPHDPYPMNLMNDSLLDQMLEPIELSFKADMSTFFTKLMNKGENSSWAGSQDKIRKISAAAAKDSDGDSIKTKIGLGTPGGAISVEVDAVDENVLMDMRDTLKWGRFAIARYADPDNLSKTVKERSNPFYKYNQNPPKNNAKHRYKFYFPGYTVTSQFAKENLGKRYIEYKAIYGKRSYVIQAAWPDLTTGAIRGVAYEIEKDNKVVQKNTTIKGLINPTEDNMELLKDGSYATIWPAGDVTSISFLADDFFTLLNSLPNWPSAIAGNTLIGTATEDLIKETIFNNISVDITNNTLQGLSNSFFFERRDKIKDFFQQFIYTQTTFRADEYCEPAEENSLLKVEEIKSMTRERNKDLECSKEKKPDLNNEPSHFANASAEALVMVLARLYAFEYTLRLLPMVEFKIKDVFKNDMFMDIVSSMVVTNLIEIDFTTTPKTSKSVYGNRNKKPVATKFYNIPGIGRGYIENPPTPAIPSSGGQPFNPKLPAHVLFYANKIVSSKSKKAEKEGSVLTDPLISNKDYIHPRNPFALDGLQFLIKEQSLLVSEFLEKELEPLFENEIDDYYLWAVKRFEQMYKPLETADANISPDFSWEFEWDSYFNNMPRLLEKDTESNQLPQFEKMYEKAESSRLNKIATEGGFILEPYIYVKQKKPIKLNAKTKKSDFTADQLESISEKVFWDIIEHYKAHPEALEALVPKENNTWGFKEWELFLIQPENAAKDAAGNPLNKINQPKTCFGESKAFVKWIWEQKVPLDLLAGNWRNYDKDFKPPGGGTYSWINQLKYLGNQLSECFEKNYEHGIQQLIYKKASEAKQIVLDPTIEEIDLSVFNAKEGSDWWEAYDISANPDLSWGSDVEIVLPKRFGDVYQGALVNVQDWYDFMGSTEISHKLQSLGSQHGEGGVLEHTEFFEPWLYGVRLTYVYPTQASDISGFVALALQTDLLKSLGIDHSGLTGNDQNILDKIKNDKAYVIREDGIRNTVPLIKTLLPVGMITPTNSKFVVGVPQTQTSSVPLNYFTYNTAADDFPKEALYKQMVNSPQFKKLFKEIFPLENVLTLAEIYILFNSLGLKEYETMFGRTKTMIKSRFYATLNSHDPTYTVDNVSMAEEDSAGCPDDDFFCKMQEATVGIPPDMMNILSMTPFSVLKALVTIIDPSWANFPLTVPGAVAYLLSLISDSMFFKGTRQGAPRKNLKDCLPTEKQETDQLPAEEKKFKDIMELFGVPEKDQKWIMSATWPRPPGQWKNILKLNPIEDWKQDKLWGHGKNPAGTQWLVRSKQRDYDTLYKFKDTLLFDILSTVTDIELTEEGLAAIQTIFNSLKEFVDTYKRTNEDYYDHAWTLYRLTLEVAFKKGRPKVFGMPESLTDPNHNAHYFNPGLPNPGFLKSSEYDKHINPACNMIETLELFDGPFLIKEKQNLCAFKNTFYGANKQLNSLIEIFSDSLEKAGISTYPINNTDNIAVLKQLTTPEFDITKAGAPGCSELTNLTHPDTIYTPKDTCAISWTDLAEETKRELLAKAIRALVWQKSLYNYPKQPMFAKRLSEPQPHGYLWSNHLESIESYSQLPNSHTFPAFYVDGVATKWDIAVVNDVPKIVMWLLQPIEGWFSNEPQQSKHPKKKEYKTSNSFKPDFLDYVSGYKGNGYFINKNNKNDWCSSIGTKKIDTKHKMKIHCELPNNDVPIGGINLEFMPWAFQRSIAEYLWKVENVALNTEYLSVKEEVSINGITKPNNNFTDHEMKHLYKARLEWDSAGFLGNTITQKHWFDGNVIEGFAEGEKLKMAQIVLYNGAYKPILGKAWFKRYGFGLGKPPSIW